VVGRADPVAVIREEAPQALSFLVEDCGLTGPERIHGDIAYHRLGLHIDMALWAWKNERGFSTALVLVGPGGAQQRRGLGALYAASGLGPATALPEGAGSLYVIRKRIGQHAEGVACPHEASGRR
jgi:hypothetical protein